MANAQTSPAIKAPTYNAVAFRRDFTALAVQNPKKAATMAGDWRARLENALVEAETATEMALQMATVGGSNLAFSMLTGWSGAKKAYIEAQWLKADAEGDDTQKAAAKAVAAGKDLAKTSPFKDGKVKDPTKMFSIPTTLWLVGGTGLLSWLARNSDQGAIARGVATGAMTTMTGELGQSFGKNMYDKKATKKTGE